MTKSELLSLISVSLPDNSTGDITEAQVRTVLTNIVNAFEHIDDVQGHINSNIAANTAIQESLTMRHSHSANSPQSSLNYTIADIFNNTNVNPTDKVEQVSDSITNINFSSIVNIINRINAYQNTQNIAINNILQTLKNNGLMLV